jgi:uncharacterized protein YjbI with pentapeptide repeats
MTALAEWKKQTPVASGTFERPYWYDTGRYPINKSAHNKVDLSAMTFSNASINRAFAENLNLSKSVFENVVIDEGNFDGANFAGCTLRNVRFNKTILTRANFDDATIVNCNFNRVILTGGSFRVRQITETVIYGISMWDVDLPEPSRQSKLVIEKTYDFYSDLIAAGRIPMMVDDISVAQFVYFLLNHKKMRDTLNVMNNKGVLILGRFDGGGLKQLYEIHALLRGRGYLPMIFDFERPDGMNLTETVITMAGLSKFIIADLSGGSVPVELVNIADKFKKPVLVFGAPNALFRDLADKTKVYSISPETGDVLGAIETRLPELERSYAARVIELAERDGGG